tara:strand:- start:767 stop:1273 length:507 start_codon:yes stop_codon:yes gene_type:complete
MSNEREYTQIVIRGSGYRRGIIDPGKLFSKYDKPKNWNMRGDYLGHQMKNGVRHVNFWQVGYIHRHTLFAGSTNNQSLSFPFHFPLTIPSTKYWWCRQGNWLPFWGAATKQKSRLMKEIRHYWSSKWFNDTLPKIKNILTEKTPLPKDIIVELTSSPFLEYPYGIKTS